MGSVVGVSRCGGALATKLSCSCLRLFLGLHLCSGLFLSCAFSALVSICALACFSCAFSAFMLQDFRACVQNTKPAEASLSCGEKKFPELLTRISPDLGWAMSCACLESVWHGKSCLDSLEAQGQLAHRQ
jgi:hypothetical protein